ncbi:AP-1-like transcription factor Yap3p [Monosporozyma servazzii]
MDLIADQLLLDGMVDVYKGNADDQHGSLIPSPCSIDVSSTDNFMTFPNNNNNINTSPATVGSATTSNNTTSPQDVDDGDKDWKKKLQNRKAQKAFRLRKEARLQELEVKLQEAEQLQVQLNKEVDTLRRDNIEMNKINRHLYKQQPRSHSLTSTPPLPSHTQDQEHFDVSFPSRDEFYDKLIAQDSKHRSSNGPVSSLEYNDNAGNVLLTVPATWQYLSQIYQNMDDADMDINAIMNSLRGHEMCHGHGAAYPKALIDQLVGLHRIG